MSSQLHSHVPCVGMQGRTIENFDHVQHGLGVEEQEEDAASKGSGLRNMSEDMKRTLGALHVSDRRWERCD